MRRLLEKPEFCKCHPGKIASTTSTAESFLFRHQKDSDAHAYCQPWEYRRGINHTDKCLSEESLKKISFCLNAHVICNPTAVGNEKNHVCSSNPTHSKSPVFMKSSSHSNGRNCHHQCCCNKQAKPCMCEQIVESTSADHGIDSLDTNSSPHETVFSYMNPSLPHTATVISDMPGIDIETINNSQYEKPWDTSEALNKLQRLNSTNGSSSSAKSVFSVDSSNSSGVSRHSAGLSMLSEVSYEKPWDQSFCFEQHCPMNHSLHEELSEVSLSKWIWWHGTITRKEAESRLRNKPVGSFLVRSSESGKEDERSLSVVTILGIVHMKINKTDNNSYILGQCSHPFDSIPAMILHYDRFEVPIKGAPHVKLNFPVPRQKSCKK